MPEQSNTASGGPIKARYHKLAADRQWYLDEAYASGRLTIPSIVPSQVDITTQTLDGSPERLAKPWQVLGARGVRNLSAKLNLTLFPPTGAFMRYQLHPQVKKELDDPSRDDTRGEFEKALSVRERVLMDDVESQNVRTKTDLAFKHLLIAGNVMLYLMPEGGVRVFPLNSFVARRDFGGMPVEIIYVELMERATAPDEIISALIAHGQEDPENPGMPMPNAGKKSETLEVYTRIRLVDGRYKVTQEADGVVIEAKNGSYAKDKLPFLALRFTVIDGEDYGRGYIEEIRGGLGSLDRLQQAIVLGAVNAAKLVPLVKPGAAITPAKLMRAENGQAILGYADDVTMLQQNKNADFAFAEQTSVRLEQSLSAAFLLNSSFQRQAERVTAEEVRRMAEELEDALGGIYSVLAQELQLPIALRTEQRLIKKGLLGVIDPQSAIKVVVVTGLAAIGRGHEFNRNREFYGHLAGEVMPLIPDIGRYLKAREVINRAAIGVGIPAEGLVKTDEEIQAEDQAAQQQAAQAELMKGGSAPFAKVAAESIGAQLARTNGAQAPNQ